MRAVPPSSGPIAVPPLTMRNERCSLAPPIDADSTGWQRVPTQWRRLALQLHGVTSFARPLVSDGGRLVAWTYFSISCQSMSQEVADDLRSQIVSMDSNSSQLVRRIFLSKSRSVGLNFPHPPTHDLEIDRESSQHIIKSDRAFVVVRDDLKKLVPDVIP